MKRAVVNAVVLTMNDRMDCFEKGYVRMRGGEITEVASMEEWKPDGEEECTDAAGMWMLPGFVNTHTHTPMTLLRGYADDLPLHAWLTEHIFPAEARLITPEHVRLASRFAFAEMIRTGTTCFNDMYFFSRVIAEEAKRAGIRAVLNDSLIDFPAPGFGTVDEGLALAEELIRAWAGDPLIHPSVCAHSPYTCSKETLLKAKRLADRYGTLFQIHLSETRQETETVKKQTGFLPGEYLHRIGVLDGNLIAAHGVWLTPGEVRLFAGSGAAIGHCPKSNLKLASGVADTASWLRAGVTVGLGTDGTASNNSLDMVEEMRFAALLPKGVCHDPEAMPARDALRMATIEGARAVGLGDRIGSLEPGKRADLLLIRSEAVNMQPVYDRYSAIVYAMNSGNIVSSMAEGEWLMQDRELIRIDEKETLNDLMERFGAKAGVLR
ncbi:MAG: amidohydrolase [Culturomica sp.]|jgi:5-methylthioadenosine/S-adenosylhomocysteine deaminase|nr:amidohydrolase [Culturomica sp.]